MTGDGKLHALPITYAKGDPRLGKPVTLTAKGLSGLRGIEQLGRYWSKDKVVRHVLIGHTKDGRLVELTVDVSKSRPALSYRVIAKGWQNVTTLAVGYCQDKPYKSHVVLIAIDSAKRVTARIDPIWNDASLKGAKTIHLAPWKGSPSTPSSEIDPSRVVDDRVGAILRHPRRRRPRSHHRSRTDPRRGALGPARSSRTTPRASRCGASTAAKSAATLAAV